ncbi:hypothetical protein [Microbacterium sp. PMB16]
MKNLTYDGIIAEEIVTFSEQMAAQRERMESWLRSGQVEGREVP